MVLHIFQMSFNSKFSTKILKLKLIGLCFRKFFPIIIIVIIIIESV